MFNRRGKSVLLAVVYVINTLFLTLATMANLLSGFVGSPSQLAYLGVNIWSFLAGVVYLILLCFFLKGLFRTFCQCRRKRANSTEAKPEASVPAAEIREGKMRGLQKTWHAILNVIALTGPKGKYFYIFEGLREVIENALQIHLLLTFSTIGVSRLYLLAFSFLVFLNLSITPVLFFADNEALNLDGLLIFDVWMDTAVGSLLPLTAVGGLIRVPFSFSVRCVCST